MKPDEFQKAYAKLVAAAWADEAVKQRLLQNPKEVLKEYGVKIPEGVDIRIVENTAEACHLILPACPDNMSMSTIESRNAAELFVCIPTYIDDCGGV